MNDLKLILSNWWTFLIKGWAYRERILGLLLQAERDHKLSDELHLARLEIGHLKEKIIAQQEELATTRGHVNKLWGFIAIRHRIDVPPENGSIRQMLQKAEGR